jgi:flagellar motor switch protein FliG
MSRFDGFDEARKLLQSLGGSHRDKLIEDIAQKDPTLAEKLKKLCFALKI